MHSVSTILQKHSFLFFLSLSILLSLLCLHLSTCSFPILMCLEVLQKSNSMEIKLQSEICLVTPPEFRFWQWWKWILILFSKTQTEINRLTEITAFTESVYHLQNFLTTVKSLIQTFLAANKNEEESVSGWLFQEGVWVAACQIKRLYFPRKKLQPGKKKKDTSIKGKQ